jgi:hypothetical protein
VDQRLGRSGSSWAPGPESEIGEAKLGLRHTDTIDNAK